MLKPIMDILGRFFNHSQGFIDVLRTYYYIGMNKLTRGRIPHYRVMASVWSRNFEYADRKASLDFLKANKGKKLVLWGNWDKEYEDAFYYVPNTPWLLIEDKWRVYKTYFRKYRMDGELMGIELEFVRGRFGGMSNYVQGWKLKDPE